MMQPSGRKTGERAEDRRRNEPPINSVNGDVRMRAYRNQDKGGGHLHITGDSDDSSIPGEKGLDEGGMTMAGHPFRCGRMHP
jgi:hypothetical protein